MVPTMLEECIQRPLDPVQQLFEEHWNPSLPTEHDWGVPTYFERMFDTDEKRAQIPLLNASSPQHWQAGSLVRFRCMVQDPSFGHEIAVDTYRAGTEGSTDGQWYSLRYVSDSHTGPGNAALQSGEVRWHDLQLLYCVSVPAETAWARHQYARRATQRWQHAAATGNGAKQSEDTPAHTDIEKAMLTRLSAKHPLPEEEHSRGVVVKILGSADDLKVADMVEFVGILGTTVVSADDGLMGGAADAGPALPCLHAIYHRTLAASTENPVLDAVSTDAQGYVCGDSLARVEAESTTNRTALLAELTALLHGDALTAEYLLLTIISRVQHRVNETAVGDLSLNITGIESLTTRSSGEHAPVTTLPNPLLEQLHGALDALLPKCLPISMTLAQLNAQPYWPRESNANTTRLSSGRLQLTAGTCLLLDETALEEGTLADNGVRNMQALAHIARQQKLDYEFPFRSEISFPTDFNLIVLSTGRSMLPVDFVLPHQPNETTNDDTNAVNITSLSADVLTNRRRYIALARLMPHHIPDEMSERVQDDFVQRRRATATGSISPISEADLSRELLLARLLAQSYGNAQLTDAHWNHAKEMETARRARLSAGVATRHTS